MQNTMQQLHKLRRQALRVNAVCKLWMGQDAQQSLAEQCALESCALESRHVARAAASWLAGSPTEVDTVAFNAAPSLAARLVAATVAAMHRSGMGRLSWLAGQLEQLRATVTSMRTMHVSSGQKFMLDRHHDAIDRLSRDMCSMLGVGAHVVQRDARHVSGRMADSYSLRHA